MNISIAKDRISRILRMDAITASQGDFLATHVPIKKLYLLNSFFPIPESGTLVSEDDVFNQYILNPDNKHQFITVYGQSGTGKSHLIRWFEAKFQGEKPDNEVVLFVRRSDNTLKGTIRQLLAMPEVCEIANQEIFERLTKATVHEDENKLKGRIYHDFINEIEFDDESKSVHLSSIKRRNLVAFLVNEVVQNHMMSDSGPIERIYSKIAEHTMVDRETIAQFSPEDFYVSADLHDEMQQAGADRKAIKIANELMSAEWESYATKYAAYLNQFLSDVIQRCAGIEAGDFRMLFQDIRKELYRSGKNLTLFIEDITSFTGVDEALIDALIVEHTGMNDTDHMCRISSIVGTTSNYLEHNFRDNHKDRITKYIYIPMEVFDEKSVFEFIGRYLNTMSIQESVIADWINNQAKNTDYPIHDLQEGQLWDFVDLADGKRLNLYPFTQNSIRYLYNTISKDHRTPRYIIRDIIEPVVIEVITEKEIFPSDKFKIANVNTTLSMSINNQIKNQREASRLLRFLSIWGNGDASQTETDGQLFVSGIHKQILEELNFPQITFATTASVSTQENQSDSNQKKIVKNPSLETSIKSSEEILISAEKIDRVNEANLMLTDWVNGARIDISANVGPGGMLKAAVADITKNLFAMINWTSEGFSADVIDKIKRTYKSNLIKLEKQTRGDGLYELPVSWESMNVLMAFVRWQHYGKESWNYPDSDLDAFIVTSWVSKIKKDLIETIRNQERFGISYIEAAIISEIYRSILVGSYSAKDLKDYSRKHLFVPGKEKTNTSHANEWKSLVSYLKQQGADQINQETIRQYYNLPQGDAKGIVVLDDLALSKTLKIVKGKKLDVNIEDLGLTDKIKLRRETYLFLKGIMDRLDRVAEAELAIARPMMESIYEYLDDDEIEEEDLADVISKIKEFYEEINKSQINIQMVSTDEVKKNVKQLTKSIASIGSVMDEEKVLPILMAFSSDPLSDVIPFYNLMDKVKKHIQELDSKIDMAKASLGFSDSSEHESAKYKEEVDVLANGLAIFGGGQSI